MSLSTLPQPIKAFLQATASRDRAALIASFANDAVLIDMGEEHRGEEIARWTDSLYLGSMSVCIRSTPRSVTGVRSSPSPSAATLQRTEVRSRLQGLWRRAKSCGSQSRSLVMEKP
jgi:hypothetical protein